MEANLRSVDAIMDQKFGKVGTSERDNFRREAYSYCMGQIIHDAQKRKGDAGRTGKAYWGK